MGEVAGRERWWVGKEYGGGELKEERATAGVGKVGPFDNPGEWVKGDGEGTEQGERNEGQR